jgi:PAT family beta-lactamase induction signal transducer AmpG
LTATVGALRAFFADPLATRRGRLWTFFWLYVCEGIPLGFTATVVATHMRREGLDPAVIGAYVGSLYLPWAFKWVMGPIVDTVTSHRFGRRRTWIVGAQIAMMLALLAAWPIDFTATLMLFTAVIFLHNVFAAAQDVAIDALAVQALAENERGAANGIMFAGQGIGQALGGAGILLLTAVVPFGATYFLVIGLLALILVGVSWRIRESSPAPVFRDETPAPGRRIVADIAGFARAAGRAFIATRSAALGVVFASLPIGAYSLALALQSNIAVEIGLADAEIGRLGLWTAVLSAAGCIAGGVLSDRYGRRRTLAIFIALTAGPALYLASAMQGAGHVMPVDAGARAAIGAESAALVSAFWTACLVHSFVQGLTYGSSTALFMDITTPAVAATQFTAYMALSNLVTTYTSTWQGITISAYGYPTTLALDAAAGLVCILVLPWMSGAGGARTRASG